MARGGEVKGRGQKGPRKSVAPSARRMPRWMLVAAVVALIGTGLLLALPAPGPSSTWPKDRGPISAREVATETRDNLTVITLSYVSQQGEARAILWLPNRTNNTTTAPPAVVHMTGMGVSAEGARNLAPFLGSLGVATLSVEKRGGPSPLWVWDLLRGFDLLAAPSSRIDPQRIVVSGDSIGANMALAAAAVEPRLKGVLVFSGFPDSRFGPDLDPSVALSRVSDRPVAFFHAREDPVIPLDQSRALFDRAREPKFFYAFNGTCHGHCIDMFPQVEEQVRQMLLTPK